MNSLKPKLKELKPDQAIERYFRSGNINNKRYKVVLVSKEDDTFFAVLKYYLSSKDCYELKIIYDFEWDINPYRVPSEQVTNPDEWIQGKTE